MVANCTEDGGQVGYVLAYIKSEPHKTSADGVTLRWRCRGYGRWKYVVGMCGSGRPLLPELCGALIPYLASIKGHSTIGDAPLASKEKRLLLVVSFLWWSLYVIIYIYYKLNLFAGGQSSGISIGRTSLTVCFNSQQESTPKLICLCLLS